MTSNGNRRKNASSSRSNSTSKRGNSKNNNTRSGSKRNTYQNRTYNSRSNKKKTVKEEYEFDYVNVLIYISIFALLTVMFLFALGLFKGGLGIFITNTVRGLFGFNAYVIPIVGIITVIYYILTYTTKKTVLNLISAFVFVVSIGLIATAIAYSDISALSFTETVKVFFHDQKGGGVIFGSLAYILDKSLGKAFVWIIAVILIIASIVVMFGKYIFRLIHYAIDKYSDLEDDEEEKEERQYTLREIKNLREKEAAARKKKISYKINDEDVPDDKELNQKNEIKNNVIDVEPTQIRSFFQEIKDEEAEYKALKKSKETHDIHQIDAEKIKKKVTDDDIKPINIYSNNDIESLPQKNDNEQNGLKLTANENVKSDNMLTVNSVKMLGNSDVKANAEDPVLDMYKAKKEEKSDKPYKFPPFSLLKKGSKQSKIKTDDILFTSNKLKETLSTFGVEVSIDPANCSKGPAVTRYELTPAPGVKVSRIVSLSDDIKLSLGAADIRIEAPIPGKSAVGIEVPNTESTAVPFRDIIETDEFSKFNSKICFAVGKDLSGQVVIADIAKMPHLLIAGATGSGKSVCINTIIMSILYKAHPDEVKMILIDPKVVELSVYNGIPHLLLPVVTDPKQASASLHWGVSEMEDRYKKFADSGVRDIKGYNEKALSEGYNKLPQIVIIVDELADLMMVAGKEVEESICRLAQLARAAGIHLIIATQRPSVDVITGLIKANMPSRIAFSVSSGIDSRTILDSNGAEKLLGKGDMLFFPQGTNKPSRVQGCFVSDDEVLNVVDFIKNQNIKGYDERIIESVRSNSSSTASVPGGDIDELFAQAGLFIIGKEKASIGALQRAFKIGFNRAARIMDQLEARGVVGPEEGTKPRKILMSEDEFRQMTEE